MRSGRPRLASRQHPGSHPVVPAVGHVMLKAEIICYFPTTITEIPRRNNFAIIFAQIG